MDLNLEQWLVITVNSYACKTIDLETYGCVLVVVFSIFTFYKDVVC
jgi:hypothetical protein